MDLPTPPPKNKGGRPKGQRHAHVSYVPTEAQKAARAKNLKRGGNKGCTKKKTATAARQAILDRVQTMDIIEFAHAAGFHFEGRPGQELVLRLMYGLPLPEGRIRVYVRRKCEGFVLEEREVSWLEYYALLTGNERIFESATGKRTGFLCVGARSGKSTITALITLYEASRNKWLQYLRPKERGYAGIIATNLDQARDLVQQACSDILEDSELSGLKAASSTRQILLQNGLRIRSFPCNTRAGRGFPYFFTCYDEAAFYYLEGAKADTAVHAAFNPRRLQFPESKHVEITTPAGKQGRFYNEFSKGAQVHNRLTVGAPTWLFRPELVDVNAEQFHEEFDENPEEFNREYGAEFDETVDRFLSDAAIDDCCLLPSDAPYDSSIYYAAGIDASGLSGNDKFGFAICGKDLSRGRHIVAVDRSYPEKDPDPILADLGELCRRYHVRQVYTDRYAKGWVHAALRKLALEPILAPDALQVWLNFRQLLTQRHVDLPSDQELQDGLRSTNVAYGDSQKPRIVRPRNKRGHGDKAEAVAKAVWGSSQNAYPSSSATPEEREQQREREEEEEHYDPLSHGRS